MFMRIPVTEPTPCGNVMRTNIASIVVVVIQTSHVNVIVAIQHHRIMCEEHTRLARNEMYLGNRLSGHLQNGKLLQLAFMYCRTIRNTHVDIQRSCVILI